MIDPNHTKLSVSRQCELIGLARVSYYRVKNVVIETDENLDLMPIIDENICGIRSMVAEKCVIICADRVTRLIENACNV